MTFSDYCASPGVNWSTLKHMGTSPAHYKSALETPRKDTPQVLLGRAVHSAVLEPDRMLEEFTVWPGTRRGKDWEAFKAAHKGRGILTKPEYDSCLAVRDAVRSNPEAAALLTGLSEVSLQWQDERTGVWCKARVDHMVSTASDSWLVDLKTAQSVTPRDFESAAARFQYYGQLAFYRRGAPLKTVYIIAVENAPPYDVVVYELDEYALAYGDDEVDRYLDRLVECTSTDTWPGQYPETQVLGLPPWLEKQTENLGVTIGGVEV